MGTTSITISNEAYRKLVLLKGEKNSFSDVINNLATRYSFLDLVGLLSNEEANELRKNVEKRRRELRREVDKVASRLK